MASPWRLAPCYMKAYGSLSSLSAHSLPLLFPPLTSLFICLSWAGQGGAVEGEATSPSPASYLLSPLLTLRGAGEEGKSHWEEEDFRRRLWPWGASNIREEGRVSLTLDRHTSKHSPAPALS